VARVLGDAELRQRFLPLVTSVQSTAVANSDVSAPEAAVASSVPEFSLVGDWLAVEFNSSNEDDAGPRMAANDELTERQFR
jgi:hypothetical protein